MCPRQLHPNESVFSFLWQSSQKVTSNSMCRTCSVDYLTSRRQVRKLASRLKMPNNLSHKERLGSENTKRSSAYHGRFKRPLRTPAHHRVFSPVHFRSFLWSTYNGIWQVLASQIIWFWFSNLSKTELSLLQDSSASVSLENILNWIIFSFTLNTVSIVKI